MTAPVQKHAAPSLVLLRGGGAVRPPLSDEEIIDAVREGKRGSADELYFRLVDAVDITLFRIFSRREVDHEDLVQRAFEQIVITISRRSFAGACSLRTWASAITARVAFNVLRSRKRERAVITSMPFDHNDSCSPLAPDGEQQTLAREDLERLRCHLAKMKPERAQAVFLHDVLGHELAEIALMEDVSVAAAQSRLVRGRKDLYKRLGVPLTPSGGRDGESRGGRLP
jgi:RNA polymerase sigma-70 factor, ECF subfamily